MSLIQAVDFRNDLLHLSTIFFLTLGCVRPLNPPLRSAPVGEAARGAYASRATFDTWDVALRYARFARATAIVSRLSPRAGNTSRQKVQSMCIHYRNSHAGYDETDEIAPRRARYCVRSPARPGWFPHGRWSPHEVNGTSLRPRNVDQIRDERFLTRFVHAIFG